MDKLNSTLNKILQIIKESPDNFFDNNTGVDLWWDEGQYTFGITDNTIVYSKDTVTHNELYYISLLDSLGVDKFSSMVCSYVEDDMIMYGEDSEGVEQSISLDLVHNSKDIDYIGNWKPETMGDRDDFDIKGRIWNNDKFNALSTWEVPDKGELYLIVKLIKAINYQPEEFLYELGDDDEPMEYNEVLDYMEYQNNDHLSSKSIQDLKSKGHLIGGKWGRAIGRL